MEGEKGKITSWDKYPYIGIKIEGLNGKSYPENQDEELVKIDTGYDGDILLPYSIYKTLKLHLREQPKVISGITVTKEEIELKCAYTTIEIPGLNTKTRAKIETWEKGETDTLIGIEFIKSFTTILNGPENKTYLEKQ